jgi:hypothetical protein
MVNKLLSAEKPYFQSFNLSNTITGRLPTKPYYLILSRLEQINLILRFWKSFKILPRSIPRRGKPWITPGKLSRNKALSMSKCLMDCATRGKWTAPPSVKWHPENRPWSNVRKRADLHSDGGETLLIVGGAITIFYYQSVIYIAVHWSITSPTTFRLRRHVDAIIVGY